MMVTIIGQGLAGTVLAWELGRAGVPWRIIDAGHDQAASRVGAGIVNPLTGRRWAPTWRIDRWRERAAHTYDTMGRELGRPLRRELRVWRRWRDPADREALERRAAQPEVVRWLGTRTAHGSWIDGAWQVDTAALIAAWRARWLADGRLQLRAVEPADLDATSPETPAVWCTGAALARLPGPRGAAWQLAGGEILDGTIAGETGSDVMLNDGHWLLPLGGARWRVGATFRRDVERAEPTAAGRAELMAAARRLTEKDLRVEYHVAAVRLNTGDKRPVAGWWPGRPGEGVLGGLGSKGTLWAPELARQWAAHLSNGAAMDEEVSPLSRTGG